MVTSRLRATRLEPRPPPSQRTRVGMTRGIAAAGRRRTLDRWIAPSTSTTVSDHRRKNPSVQKRGIERDRSTGTRPAGDLLQPAARSRSRERSSSASARLPTQTPSSAEPDRREAQLADVKCRPSTKDQSRSAEISRSSQVNCSASTQVGQAFTSAAGRSSVPAIGRDSVERQSSSRRRRQSEFARIVAGAASRALPRGATMVRGRFVSSHESLGARAKSWTVTTEMCGPCGVFMTLHLATPVVAPRVFEPRVALLSRVRASCGRRSARSCRSASTCTKSGTM